MPIQIHEFERDKFDVFMFTKYGTIEYVAVTAFKSVPKLDRFAIAYNEKKNICYFNTPYFGVEGQSIIDIQNALSSMYPTAVIEFIAFPAWRLNELGWEYARQ